MKAAQNIVLLCVLIWSLTNRFQQISYPTEPKLCSACVHSTSRTTTGATLRLDSTYSEVEQLFKQIGRANLLKSCLLHCLWTNCDVGHAGKFLRSALTQILKFKSKYTNCHEGLKLFVFEKGLISTIQLV